MLKISDLGIIQDELRNPGQIADMIKHIEERGFFHHCKPLIEIAQFSDDNRHYIHNGHHRAVAMYLAGREYISTGEYYIKTWTYKDYDDVVFFNEDRSWRGYVTPFDVRKEARIANLAHHKETVQKVFALHGEEAARLYIKQTRPLYCYSKRHYTVKDLANEYLRNNEPIPAGGNAEARFRIEEEAFFT
jgi:hypothetical protein